MKVGSLVTYTPQSPGAMKRMTEGVIYTVTAYDPNTKGWPDGCCGTPFVTVIADDGEPFEAMRYRFKLVPGSTEPLAPAEILGKTGATEGS